jgi:HK97 gp10 family phage protein
MATGLEGVADLTKKLVDIAGAMAPKELRGTVKGAIEEAEHLARARIPQGTEPHKTYRGRLVSPGFAVSTLHVETYINKRTGAAVAALGTSREAFYATLFVELGTVNTPAQPWLRPAFEESQDPMLRKIADELRARVEKIAKRNARAGK